jgi:hypothetical protein
VNKITAILKNYIHRHPLGKVEVVIELTPCDTSNLKLFSLSRKDKISLIQDSFNEEVKPVKEAILHAGGNLIESAWVNQTVSASVPVKNIHELAKLNEITAIDLPRSIARE